MTTRPRDIPFGEWLPDLPPLENQGALEALNCIPELNSYRSMNSLSPFSDAINNPALGSFWLQGSDNVIYNFVGNATRLYQLTQNNTVWSNVSAREYATADNWEFAKFGDRVLATNINEPIQYYDAGAAPGFANLPGSPPQCARIATVRDFVVIGDIQGSDRGPNFVQWSGFNNSEIWTPSRSTQSDFQELFGRGGRVQKIVPGEYGVIFQEHSIHRMDYIGPPVIFQFDEVERGRGTPAPNSVIWTGNLIFYYGHDGFYRFTGQASEPIGANRINRWFESEADISALGDMRGAIDRENRLAMWTFKSDAQLAANDRMIVFNWAANRWSHAEINTQIIAEYVTSGLTLEDLDSLYSNTIDGTNQTPFDSGAYIGGALNFLAFDDQNRAATFAGAPLEATIDTAEFIGPNARRVYVNSIRPIVNGGPETGIRASVGRRSFTPNNITFSTSRGMNKIGEANMRVNDRYLRFRLDITGGFTHAVGVQAMVRENAGRQ